MRIVVMLLPLALAFGCARENNTHLSVAEPACLDELRLATCAIVTNDIPVATGFFVSTQSESLSNRTYYCITAAHVVSRLANEMPYMMVGKKGSLESVKEPCLGRWYNSGRGTDVRVLEISSSVRSLIKKGAEFRCINIDVDSTNRLSNTGGALEICGAGVLQKYLFKEFKVGLGAECCSIGTCFESWEGQVEKSELPLVCRKGQIAQIPRGKAYCGRDRNGQRKGVATDLFLTDFQVFGGMSGAPVFVKGQLSTGQNYWYLAGVMVGQVPGKESDEIALLRSDDARFRRVDEEHLIVTSTPYQHLGTTNLSIVVPYEEILSCISTAEGAIPSFLDCLQP